MVLRSLTLLSTLFVAALTVAGYEVPIVDRDYSRQICSGMWSNAQTYINGKHPSGDDLQGT